VLFAHRTSDGELSGFEVKNRSFTGFSPGGVKSFFRSNSMQEVTTAVFSESAIDLLSVASIFGTKERQFFSTAGQISPMQLDLLIQTLKAMPSLTTVWLALYRSNYLVQRGATGTTICERSIPLLKSQACDSQFRTPVDSHRRSFAITLIRICGLE